MVNPTRRVARAIVYRDFYEIPEFLLLLTPKYYWQNPQGGIEQHEVGEKGNQRAAYREGSEETGLSRLVVEPHTRTTAQYIAKQTETPFVVDLVAYALKHTDQSERVILNMSNDVHLDHGWFDFEESLERLVRHPEQKQVFEQVTRLAGLAPIEMKKPKKWEDSRIAGYR